MGFKSSLCNKNLKISVHYRMLECCVHLCPIVRNGSMILKSRTISILDVTSWTLQVSRYKHWTNEEVLFHMRLESYILIAINPIKNRVPTPLQNKTSHSTYFVRKDLGRRGSEILAFLKNLGMDGCVFFSFMLQKLRCSKWLLRICASKWHRRINLRTCSDLL